MKFNSDLLQIRLVNKSRTFYSKLHKPFFPPVTFLCIINQLSTWVHAIMQSRTSCQMHVLLSIEVPVRPESLIQQSLPFLILLHKRWAGFLPLHPLVWIQSTPSGGRLLSEKLNALWIYTAPAQTQRIKDRSIAWPCPLASLYSLWSRIFFNWG